MADDSVRHPVAVIGAGPAGPATRTGPDEGHNVPNVSVAPNGTHHASPAGATD
jgi:hypothetical protein